MDFWQRLDWLIKERGLTRKSVSASVGIADSSISVWKYRKTYPDVDVGLRLAGLLKVSVEYLVFGPDNAGGGTVQIDAEGLFVSVTIPRENQILLQIVEQLTTYDQDQLGKVREIVDLLLK